VYAEHDSDSWSLGLGLGYARHDVRTARGIQVGPIARQAVADYRGDQYSGLLSAGVALHRTTSTTLKAFSELRYSALTRHAFEESGADSASLTDISDARTKSLRTLLGVRASWVPKVWRMRMTPELKIAWARESLDDRGEATAGLTGASALSNFTRFTVFGATEARNAAVVSLGTTAALIEHGQAFVSYDGNFTQQASEHGMVAGVRLSW
jgi:subtilase-type serine protease